jgi:hypothetical protein
MPTNVSLSEANRGAAKTFGNTYSKELFADIISIMATFNVTAM